MSLPIRSQSALEYMMTYGWAILIIVIVAGVLYSLGIFSPSSSLSTTITGFANLGTVNAVCLGGTSFTISMGDSTGYPINITQINLTSSSGKTTYSPNILIQSNSIQTVTVPSSSLCSPGARYSVSAVISYLEPGQIFPVPYTSTGTVAGTAVSPPSSATSYEPLTITNSQNQGTPTPFQQMINVTSSSPGWADISSSPFGQNVEFFSVTGQILDSWLENYTSTHAIWWVKLTSSIPVGSKQTIYMGFASTSTNLFNTNNIGEAPRLSPTYAEYDDGVNVFNFYDNFAGTSLNTQDWTNGITQTGGIVTVNNGLTLTGGSSWAQLRANEMFDPQTSVAEFYGNMTGSSYMQFGYTNPYQYIIDIVDSSQNQYAIFAWNDTQSVYHPFTANNNNDIFSVWINSTDISGGYNYRTLTYSLNNIQAVTNESLAFQMFDSEEKIYAQWARVRAYPPNGVMPSVSFGSVS